MTTINLCSGILRRGRRVLLARCLYPGEPQALWTLPGGRQEPGETKAETVVRELWEEASLRVRPAGLAYLSESLDEAGGLHVMNVTFWLDERDGTVAPAPQDRNVLEVRFVEAREAPGLLRADVLRIPVEAALAGDEHPQYFSFRAQDVKVPFFSTPSASGKP